MPRVVLIACAVAQCLLAIVLFPGKSLGADKIAIGVVGSASPLY